MHYSNIVTARIIDIALSLKVNLTIDLYVSYKGFIFCEPRSYVVKGRYVNDKTVEYKPSPEAVAVLKCIEDNFIGESSLQPLTLNVFSNGDFLVTKAEVNELAIKLNSLYNIFFHDLQYELQDLTSVVPTPIGGSNFCQNMFKALEACWAIQVLYTDWRYYMISISVNYVVNIFNPDGDLIARININ